MSQLASVDFGVERKPKPAKTANTESIKIAFFIVDILYSFYNNVSSKVDYNKNTSFDFNLRGINKLRYIEATNLIGASVASLIFMGIIIIFAPVAGN